MMKSKLLHLFNGLFSRITWVSRHQKGKPFWILLEQEMMGHKLDHMQIISTLLRQITVPVPHHSVFTGQICPSCRPTNTVKELKAQ